MIQPVENVDGFLQTQRYPDKSLQSTYGPDGDTTPRDGRMRRKLRAIRMIVENAPAKVMIADGRSAHPLVDAINGLGTVVQ